MLPAAVATRLPGVEEIWSGIARLIGEPVRRDAELLRSIGVDLEEIRAAVRRTFGDQAIDRLRRPIHQPWQPWRRPSRRCTSLLAGTMTVAARVKEASALLEKRIDAACRPLSLPFSCSASSTSTIHSLTASYDDNGIDPTEIRGILVGYHR